MAPGVEGRHLIPAHVDTYRGVWVQIWVHLGDRAAGSSLMAASHVTLAQRQPLKPAHVPAEALPRGRDHRTRSRTQPRAPATARVRRASTPASLTRLIKISTKIDVRNARTGLSRTTTAIDHMAQVGRLLTRTPLVRSRALPPAAATAFQFRRFPLPEGPIFENNWREIRHDIFLLKTCGITPSDLRSLTFNHVVLVTVARPSDH